jgi:hypothetical protein
MQLKYNNEEHLFNCSKKMLFNKNILSVDGDLIEDDIEILKTECKELYDMSYKYWSEINKLHLNLPAHYFTYKLSLIKNYEELENLYCIMIKIKYKYKILIKNFRKQGAFVKIDKFLEENSCYYKNKEWNNVIKKSMYDKREFSKELKEEVLKCSNYAGVYMFYGQDKKTIIYVGKSARDLSERMRTSSMEKENIYYFSYALTKTRSDVGIYEAYYIAKLKPKYNIDMVEDDELTIELPELHFTEVKPLYESDDIV